MFNDPSFINIEKSFDIFCSNLKSKFDNEVYDIVVMINVFSFDETCLIIRTLLILRKVLTFFFKFEEQV
jgi:hypothetical protein